MDRTCDECRECCTVLKVTELDKPRMKPCEFICSSGCSIYTSEDRPGICGEFRCGWLLGLGDENDRPDKSGVIAQLTDSGKDGESIITMFECRDNAFSEGRGMSLVGRVSGYPISVCLQYFDGSTMESPVDVR